MLRDSDSGVRAELGGEKVYESTGTRLRSLRLTGPQSHGKVVPSLRAIALTENPWRYLSLYGSPQTYQICQRCRMKGPAVFYECRETTAMIDRWVV